MPTNVIMPALGVAQEKGTLINWRKAEGDSVAKGEPLMEVETDKATVEIEAPASGVLAQVSAEAGDEVPVGHTIAVILGPGEQATPRTPKVAATASKAPETSSPATRAQSVPSTAVPNRIAASPAAKRLAREKNIDLRSLRGSGPQASIVVQDVLRADAAPRTPTPAMQPKTTEIVSLTPMRRILGQRMSASKQSAPHFYVSLDIDMTEVCHRRNEHRTTDDSVNPSINDFVLAATARTLRSFPYFNAAYTDHGIEVYAEINLGMAVALDEGLVVPVVRDADRLSLAVLAVQTRQLAEKAHTKKLVPADYEGGTFTVSNLGMLGIDSFVAIINPPQCAILAVGQVAPRVISDGTAIMIRSMMTATLSADHRIVDGAAAARFLTQLKQLLENPDCWREEFT